MKRTLSLLFACAALTAARPALADGEDPVPNPPVPVDAHDLFVPVGFDSNDESLAVLSGYFPGTCYKEAYATTSYDEATQTFTITQYMRQVHSICLEMLVPFTSEVDLGVLKPGTYHVVTHGATDESLLVRPATIAATDDHVYAPVSSAHVERDPVTGHYVGVVEGLYTNTCMAWGKAVVTDHGKTIEVMPVMAGFDGGGACLFKERPFEERIPLPWPMATGHHLLHVRSLSGRSVSVVFTVAP